MSNADHNSVTIEMSVLEAYDLEKEEVSSILNLSQPFELNSVSIQKSSPLKYIAELYGCFPFFLF